MRSRPLALGGLAVGALAGMVSSAQPWWRATGDGVAVTFSGSEASGGLSQALAVVVLAGWVLVLVLRARGRRVLGALLSLVGAGMVATGVLRPRPSPETVLAQVRAVSLIDQFALRTTGWPVLYVCAGLLVTAAAGLVVLTAARWPLRVDRFERTGPGAVALDAETDPAEVWRAMDAGIDPTSLDVREDPRGDRMADAPRAEKSPTRSSHQAE
jgi:uncharacterized membrane protein (TIGR02234 family)